MSRSAADLPEDPADLRRFAAALAAEVHSKTLLIEKLRMQLSILRRARFGRSSEKLDREIEQLELLLGDIEESDAERQARTEASHGGLWCKLWLGPTIMALSDNRHHAARTAFQVLDTVLSLTRSLPSLN
jgi:hypothetical protein